MNNAELPTERVLPSAASAARTHDVRGMFRRIRLGIRMHHLLFIVFTVIASVPIAVLAVWENRPPISSNWNWSVSVTCSSRAT